MTAAGWLRVANGFRLVASSGSKILVQEGMSGASGLTKHGVELANNAKTAVMAVGVSLPHVATTTATTNVSAAVNSPTSQASQGGYEHEAVSMSPLPSVEKDGSKSIQTNKPTPIPTDHKSIPTDERKDVLISKEVQQKFEHSNQSPVLQEGRAVPATRTERAIGFASLGVGLAAGTILEAASRIVSTKTESTSDSIVANDANADRIAKTLCRMRGAALKLGQMLSIQDETLLPAPMARALEQVRQGADAMPSTQLHAQLVAELGNDWRDKFNSFEDLPFAAASIGQVHRATILEEKEDGDSGVEKQVVVKVQYPGVANSIESDLRNLTMLVKMSGFAPPGLFIERVIEVGRDELKVECDYVREAANQQRLQDLVHGDAGLAKAKFRVPSVLPDHSSEGVLTTDFCPGGTIDKVSFLDQEERNRIGRNIMKLTVKELFTWRFMQTDPNWGNFLYDVGTGTTYLIDFGSTREYSKSFVDRYLRIVWACANDDTETLMEVSHEMGFLTGEENEIMLEAHKRSGFTLGEPFATDGEYDFKNSGITGRLSDHGSAFLQHRLTPPPEEVYTLHRKLAGAFNLCIKLGAEIKCRDLLEDVINNHVFEDGKPHPNELRLT